MINKSIRPEDVLAEDENYTVINGIKVRKGTIAAVLQNAVILSWVKLHKRGKSELQCFFVSAFYHFFGF